MFCSLSQRAVPRLPPVEVTNSGCQRICVDGCDSRAPVRDLYDLNTSRCPPDAWPDRPVYRGGANIRPECPGASRAGSGDCAFACGIAAKVVPIANMTATRNSNIHWCEYVPARMHGRNVASVSGEVLEPFGASAV
jgi:hypothetical protein